MPPSPPLPSALLSPLPLLPSSCTGIAALGRPVDSTKLAVIVLDGLNAVDAATMTEPPLIRPDCDDNAVHDMPYYERSESPLHRPYSAHE